MKSTARKGRKRQPKGCLEWRLFKWLHPDARQTTNNLDGVVGYTFYLENMGWHTWFPCELDHNFLDEIMQALDVRYKKSRFNWLHLYNTELQKAVGTPNLRGVELLFPTLSQKAKALLKTIDSCAEMEKLMNAGVSE